MAELLLKQEVYAIVGAAMAVHNELRGGFLEAVYQEVMEVKLASRRIPFVPQDEIGVGRVSFRTPRFERPRGMVS